MEILGFELKWIHVLGPLLATAAMYFVGDNMVRQETGRQLRILPTFGMFILAVAFHFLVGDGTLLDRISLMLLDFGIGMIIDAGYLKRKGVHPKVFWGLGMTTLVMAVLLKFGLSLFGIVWDKLSSPATTAEPQAELIVELGPDDDIRELQSLMKKHHASWSDAFPEVDMKENEDLAQDFLITLPASHAEAFLSDAVADRENVDYAGYNSEVNLIEPTRSISGDAATGSFLTDDPMVNRQWWMKPEVTNELHGLLKDHPPAKKAKVAIVDTGVDASHEDVKDGFGNSPGGTDGHGHGTHCACLAGGITNNRTGIASLNWEGKFIQVVSYPGLNKRGQGSIQSVAKAIIDAAESGADVISLSLGGPSRKAPKPQVDAVKYALSRNAVVIVAAGNSNDDARRYSPANIDGVITVAAIDESGGRAFFSNINTGLKMPIAAPGTNILSCTPNQGYDSWNGTSMATPIVSGLCGIIRAYRPDLSPAEVYSLLKETGMKGPGANETGNTVDALAVVKGIL